MPQQDPQQYALGVWRDLMIDDFGSGGVVLDIDSEILEKNELIQAQNAVLRGRKIKTDSGYVAFRGAVIGNPRCVVEYVDGSNVTQRLLITDATVYRDKTSEWQYVQGGTGLGNTTLTGAHAGAATNLVVASSANFANGDRIGIALTNGLQHRTTVNGAPPDGTHINITAGLPSGASNGAAVIEPPLLQGITTCHVTAYQIPWAPDNIVFTNGVDKVKQYAGAGTGTVNDITGTGFATGGIARTLAIFDNSLVLGNLDEAGTKSPSRLKVCAKGDLTLWNTLEAVTSDVLDGLGAFQQLLKLGPYLVGYRDFGITRVSVSGSLQKRFQIDPGVVGCGVWSTKAAADLTDKHIVFGKDKFFYYRGGNAYEEIPCSIKEFVFDPASVGRYISQQESFTLPIRRFNEVIFAYGVNNFPGPSPRYHTDNGKWSFRKFGDGAHKVSGYGERVSSGLFDGNIFIGLASPTLQVGEYDYATDSDLGTNLTFQLTTKDFCQPGYIIKVDFCEISVTAGSQAFTVEYSLDKGANWTQILSDVGNGNAKVLRVNKQFSGRNIRFRFTQTGRCTINWFNVRHCYDSEW